MIVIKLGGSLLQTDTLQSCLDHIARIFQHKKVIVVPGGGVFADRVRLAQQQWHFDDRTAHQMALLAMQQMALVFNARKPDFLITHTIANIGQQLGENSTLIWSPDITELDNAGIASTWDITSDSLSAWLAKTLGADELIVVKSVKIDVDFNMYKLIEQKIVDEGFHDFITGSSFQLKIIYAKDFLSWH
ncbi:MAG: uridylate kinase [Methyloglobulus sp.]|nr:uridylate kinase [Methyloglobulus sp.]